LKTLYLLRHAKAGESPLGDAARPLVKKGRKAAEAMGAFLGTLEPAPELVLCSTAVRTRETLELVLTGLSLPRSVLFEEELYLAEPAALLARLHEVPAATAAVLVIGHNPGLHELGARLATEPGRLAEGFPTAALAAFMLKDWAELRWHRAKLKLYRTPKDLNREFDAD
jgi:phosphohistidine phosphatase